MAFPLGPLCPLRPLGLQAHGPSSGRSGPSGHSGRRSSCDVQCSCTAFSVRCSMFDVRLPLPLPITPSPHRSPAAPNPPSVHFGTRGGFRAVSDCRDGPDSTHGCIRSPRLAAATCCAAMACVACGLPSARRRGRTRWSEHHRLDLWRTERVTRGRRPVKLPLAEGARIFFAPRNCRQ